jgi:membrane-associated protease RseP (regulator of RpoE activity)
MPVYAVMTVFVFGHTFNFLLQLVIFILIILPIYLFGNFVFEKYKSTYRKYRTTENKKVIVLNEKYLKRKKRLSKFKKYNSFFREEK